MKVFLEFLSLLGFFAIYKFYNLIYATFFAIFTTTIIMLYEYIKTKKLNYMNLFTLIILIVFASLSIYTQDSNFIKMKPTALYCFFAIVLLTGLLRKKIFLRYALGPVLKINDEEWFKLSQIWIVFFIILALLNEIIWRLCDENTWVYSKVFVFPTILLLFIAGQLFFFRKKI